MSGRSHWRFEPVGLQADLGPDEWLPSLRGPNGLHDSYGSSFHISLNYSYLVN